MNILSKIVSQKKLRLAEAKELNPLAEVKTAAAKARARAETHRFAKALSDDDRLRIIAEFKRRSPSKGEISSQANAVEIAKKYEAEGAAAISVLTEEDHFAGSLEDFRAVRSAVALPLLRKDFIFDEYQVYESAANGADALLLIVSILDNALLSRLRVITEDELGMDALVEVHNPAELQRAVDIGAEIIGVNNRDLTTFEVSLETSVNLASITPSGKTLISESGISNAEDIHRLHSLGYKGFLIGESLMRADDLRATWKGLV